MKSKFEIDIRTRKGYNVCFENLNFELCVIMNTPKFTSDYLY